MLKLQPSAAVILDSLNLAVERGLFPTQLSHADLASLGQGLWRQAFFSARTTSAEYLSALKKLVERYLAGGRDADLGKLRVEARALLGRLGYTPETGFAEDAGQVPPAEAGSLRDLSSERRLNLIFEVNRQIFSGATQRTRGLARQEDFPAWELIRIYVRRVPRGSPGSSSPGWHSRWVKCGGPPPLPGDWTGQRLIALKTDPIWEKLGDASFYDDALDVDHPPFAWNSGMGWRELERAECKFLGLSIPPWPWSGPAPAVKDHPLPKSLDPATKLALLKQLNAGGQGFTLDQLKGAIRGQLQKFNATNDAAHLHAALLGVRLLTELES